MASEHGLVAVNYRHSTGWLLVPRNRLPSSQKLRPVETANECNFGDAVPTREAASWAGLGAVAIKFDTGPSSSMSFYNPQTCWALHRPRLWATRGQSKNVSPSGTARNATAKSSILYGRRAIGHRAFRDRRDTLRITRTRICGLRCALFWCDDDGDREVIVRRNGSILSLFALIPLNFLHAAARRPESACRHL